MSSENVKCLTRSLEQPKRLLVKATLALFGLKDWFKLKKNIGNLLLLWKLKNLCQSHHYFYEVMTPFAFKDAVAFLSLAKSDFLIIAVLTIRRIVVGWYNPSTDDLIRRRMILSVVGWSDPSSDDLIRRRCSFELLKSLETFSRKTCFNPFSHFFPL